MPWSDPLTAPIVLRNGRTLTTLKDVGEYFLAMSTNMQSRPTVAYAAKMVTELAEGGKTYSAKEVREQVMRALSDPG